MRRLNRENNAIIRTSLNYINGVVSRVNRLFEPEVVEITLFENSNHIGYTYTVVPRYTRKKGVDRHPGNW